ncbi:MAG TPA: phosphonate ABC transporter, permease protein PhnE [Anaerolineae bacterium]|nr:phosphonate ABC transporter, permease protein PhnE [Anaerolineae bacterium]
MVAGALSLVIPGAGQVYAGRLWRGAAILFTTLLLAFLVNWALLNFHIGEMAIGGSPASWLSGALIAFWLWNVIDAYQLAQGRSAPRWIAFFLPALIIYVVAWQVIDVELTRLITRFSDAQIVFRAIVNPDLVTRDKALQIGQTGFNVPCSDLPVAEPTDSQYQLTVEPNCGDVGDTITVRGEGFKSDENGRLYWLYDLDGSNEAQVREGGQPVEASADANGRFEATFTVPAFAGVPSAASQQLIQARFEQEVGPLKPSTTFGDIFGRTVDGAFVSGKIFETIALGLMATILSTVLAVPLSFFAARNIMSRVPGGTAIYYAMRTFLNVVRAIDTIIWGLIVIVWVGLGPFAGLIALTIHSVAALGKLFSEEIEHIDPGPIEALTSTGANLLQVVRYAVLPQIYPPFLAYTLLRWDINMRSATVVGFVAGGGIGFFVVETIRKGGYPQYAAALWAIAVVVIIVDYVSGVWRQRILTGDTKAASAKPRPFYRSLRALVYVTIGAAVFAYCWNATQINLGKLFEPAPTFGRLVGDFVAIDLNPDVLDTVIKQMLITIFQALVATTLGGLLAIPFSFVAARNLMGQGVLTRAIYYATRSLFNVLRSIEALLYAAIFVFWVGIGPFAGALALAITTFALIGKLFSEAIENIDPGPVEAIAATGATRLQAIVYAILPQIIPPFISFSIYQWDINIRISTIIGFAGGGGIGLQLSTYFGQLQYHKAGTVVAMIVIVVAAMDFASAEIRKRYT